MSYNYSIPGNPSWDIPPSVNSNNNGNAEGSQSTESNNTTPTEPQGNWPRRSSQEGERPLQGWNSNLNPMYLNNNAPGNTQEYGQLPNNGAPGVFTGSEQGVSSILNPAGWGHNDFSDDGYFFDMAGGNYVDPYFDFAEYPPSTTAGLFAMPAINQNSNTATNMPGLIQSTGDSSSMPSDGRQQQGQILQTSEGTGAPAESQPSADADNATTNTSAQLDSAVQSAGVAQQSSRQHRVVTPDETPASPKSVASRESTPETTGSRRASETPSIPVQEATTSNRPHAGIHTEFRQGTHNQAAGQFGGAGQQNYEHQGATSGYRGGQVGVASHATFESSRDPDQGTPQQPTGQPQSMLPTSGDTRLPGTARHSARLRLLAPAPPTARLQSTPQDNPQPTPRKRLGRPPGRRQSTPQNQREDPPAQSRPPQPSRPQGSEPMFPNRLSSEIAALADVEPANQFMESVSNMHVLDQVACIDLLMGSEMFKDYLNPHLWDKYKEGLSNGAKYATSKHMNWSVEKIEKNHEGQAMMKKVEFQDKQIQRERRQRQRPAGMLASGMMTGASEIGDMTPSGSKRHRQASSTDYGRTDERDHYSIDSESDSMVSPQHSPKKPRHLQSTPSDLVNKFCSPVNIGNRNPFFHDPIHTQLRSLCTTQLIEPAPEYIAQNGELADTNVEHWRACAGQAGGLVMGQDEACQNCADHMEDGTVPFATCVVIGPDTPAGRELEGACMSCVYLGKDQECSLRRGEGEETRAE